ncbi:MAG TPA: hypothetical protein VLA55_07650 [Ornithinibacter sp.]|nr:hypothetical protein [Ornithinibacter sp.]
MAKHSIQGYVELASGLGELTRSRAKEAAQEIVALASQETSRKKLAKQAGALTDELLKAAEANRKHLVRLVRREVDAAVGKLGIDRLTSEVQGLGATVAALASQVEELARSAAGVEVRGSASAATSLADLPETAVTTPARTTPARKSPARKSASTTAAKRTATKKTATSTAARKAPARKAASTTAAKKTATSTAKKTATSTAAKKAPAKKAPSGVTTARKAPARRAPAKGTAKTSSSNPTAPTPSTTAPTPSTTAPTSGPATSAETAAPGSGTAGGA